MNPKFETNRLMLRLFELSDAKMVQTLAGTEEVARTTLSYILLISETVRLKHELNAS